MLRCVEEDGLRNYLRHDGDFMPNALLSSLSSTLKLTTPEEIARTLGESEQAVSKGLQLATAAILTGFTVRRGSQMRCDHHKANRD